MKPMEFVEYFYKKKKTSHPVTYHDIMDAAECYDKNLTARKMCSAIGAARVGNRILPPPTPIKVGNEIVNYFI